MRLRLHPEEDAVTDNCPNCCHNQVESHASSVNGDTLTDRYRCPECGHTWTTRRSVAAYQGFDPSQYPAPTVTRKPSRLTTPPATAA
jgi:transposase-like protein